MTALPQIGQQIERTECGERCIYRILKVDRERGRLQVEPVSIAGFVALGVPVWIKIERRSGRERRSQD